MSEIKVDYCTTVLGWIGADWNVPALIGIWFKCIPTVYNLFGMPVMGRTMQHQYIANQKPCAFIAVRVTGRRLLLTLRAPSYHFSRPRVLPVWGAIVCHTHGRYRHARYRHARYRSKSVYHMSTQSSLSAHAPWCPIPRTTTMLVGCFG